MLLREAAIQALFSGYYYDYKAPILQQDTTKNKDTKVDLAKEASPKKEIPNASIATAQNPA